MKKSKAYRATQVKRVCLERVLAGREGQRAVVGLDVSKESILAVVRWGESDFERPWKVDNPLEIRELVQLVLKLGKGRELVVALEPTGTYGDPVRQALADAGVVVDRVSPKMSHDYAEVFDGVPSQHDGKDAAVVAELAALGKSARWAFAAESWERELAYWVERLEVQRRLLTIWYGRLEGLLARHWPEATRTLSLSSGVLLRCLSHYGGPAGLANDPEASDRLDRYGRGQLPTAKAASLLAGAKSSVGVRQVAIDVQRIRESADEALARRRDLHASKRRLKQLVCDHEVIQAQAAAVGVVTASVLWAYLGDPRGYDSGGAYRKAMGLNLKERSSGRWKGQLKISKRGHGQVRRWLYWSALRWVRKGGVKSWYDAKVARSDEDAGRGRAVVGVMRRLAVALYQVGARGKEFDASLLFPGRRRSSRRVA